MSTITTATDNRQLVQFVSECQNLFLTKILEYQNLFTPTMPEIKTDPAPAKTEHKKIFGIRGLAGYLSVSVPTAQRLKNSNKFTFYESGAKVFFYSDEVDSGLRVAALEKKERVAK